VKEAILLS